MKYVVGYAAHSRGRDALRLGIAMARSMRAELEVVLVVRVAAGAFESARRTAGNYQQMVEDQAKEWLAEAAETVPDDVVARFRMHRAESAAVGLMEAARATGAGAIIVGGSSTSAWRWHGIGVTDNALFHRSPVPVIMAPRGYPDSAAITRIDCAVRPSPESTGLVDEAIATANRTGMPVRLVCLVGPGDDRAREAVREVGRMVKDSAVTLEDREGLEIVVGAGETVPDAVENIDWDPGSVLMTGSSKLARRGELFLPSTASKILTRLPIPVVLVPRDYSPGRGDSDARPWTGQLRVVGLPKQGSRQ